MLEVLSDFLDSTAGVVVALTALIGAMSVPLGIVVKWFKSLLKKQKKETEKMFSELEVKNRLAILKASEEKAERRGNIYGLLYDILNEMEADRISLIQVHPESSNEEDDIVGRYLSTSFEIISPRRSVQRFKDEFQWYEIKKNREFFDSLKKNKLIYFKDTSMIKDEKAKYFRREALHRKSKTAIFVRIESPNGIFRGSMCIEYVFDKFQYLDKYKDYLETCIIKIENDLMPYLPEHSDSGVCNNMCNCC